MYHNAATVSMHFLKLSFYKFKAYSRDCGFTITIIVYLALFATELLQRGGSTICNRFSWRI